MPTVWVLHPVREDISAAAQHGTVRYIVDADVEGRNGRYVYGDELTEDGLLPVEVTKRLREAAINFEDHDLLLIAGDHLQLVQMTYFLTLQWSQFKVLRYDRDAKGYWPAVISS